MRKLPVATLLKLQVPCWNSYWKVYFVCITYMVLDTWTFICNLTFELEQYIVWFGVHSHTVEVEIMVGGNYSTFAIWPWCGELNIVEMTFLRRKKMQTVMISALHSVAAVRVTYHVNQHSSRWNSGITSPIWKIQRAQTHRFKGNSIIMTMRMII